MWVTFSSFPTTFPALMFELFLLLSGFGCHYLHLHKGECQTDQYLEGCEVYKPLKNRVSFTYSHVIFLKNIFTKQYLSHYRIKGNLFVLIMYRQKSFNLEMSKIMLIFNTMQEYGVISISWYFIAIAAPHSCSVSSSCPSE